MFTLSTPAGRRPYHHGDLRQALVRSALEILSEAGVGGLSLRAAARRARVSAMAPYRHFADKEALLAAVAEYGFRELATRLPTPLGDRPPSRSPRFRMRPAQPLQADVRPDDREKIRTSGLGQSGQRLFQRPSAGRRGGEILRG